MASGHVVVCGLGKLGLRLVEELRTAGAAVVVVAVGPSEADRARLAALAVDLVEGDYRDEVVLERAGVRDARALGAVADDDRGNLRCALRAQMLNRELRIVLRLFNEDMGERIQRLFGDCTILSSSGIAAPFFVAAALGETHGLRVGAANHGLLIDEYDPADPAAVELGPVLTPLASRDGTRLFPEQASAGDLVLRDLGPFEDLKQVTPKPAPGASGGWWQALGQIINLRFRITLVATLALVLIGGAIFALAKHMSYIDGVYFCVVTVSTVGYGDITLLGDSTLLKLLGIAFIGLGATLVAIFYALLIDALIGARLAQILGSVRGKLRGHIVVCGLGNVGFRVVERLAVLGESVVVVEQDELARHLPAVRRLGVPIVIGDAGLANTLHTAQVEHARAVIACTDDDVSDLEAAVTAHTLAPDVRVVLRLSDDSLVEQVRAAFALSISRSVPSIAAPVFASELLEGTVLASVPVGAQSLVVTEFTAAAGQTFDGAVRVIAVIGRNEDAVWMPATPAVDAGDRVVVVGLRADVELLTRQ